MLNVKSTRCLASILGVTREALIKNIEEVESNSRELYLVDPQRPDKRRTVLDIYGSWKIYSNRVYSKLLLPKLIPSIYSHGGIKGRSIVSNAKSHKDSAFAFKSDISNFYPTIHRERVYEMFVRKFHCSPDVSRICTRLCTYKHHLALGLTTSPILADQALEKVDRRIGAACEAEKLVFTRFVDDITISGDFDLQESGFSALVEKILRQEGFELNPAKSNFGRLSEGFTITTIRIKKGRLDVRKEYVEELLRQLRDARELATDTECFEGPYYTPSQIRGRVQFVCAINPNRRFKLMRLYRPIDWPRVVDEAARRGLVACKKQLELKPK